MIDTVSFNETELGAIAAGALRVAMRELPFEGVEVTVARDWSDEPSIFVVAKLGPGVPPLDGALFSRIHGALHEALLAKGECRFPYFRLRRAYEMPVDDGDPVTVEL